MTSSRSLGARICWAMLVAVPVACWSQPLTPRVLGDAQALSDLLDAGTAHGQALDGLRVQLLREAGRKSGFRVGLQQRGRALSAALERRAGLLDRLFHFAGLMADGGLLPPVVEEARDVAAVGADQIRTADKVYNIARAERFVSVPPSWRDYLFAGLAVQSGTAWPDIDVVPKSEAEAAAWRAAVRSGWDDGVSQADAILAANFNRLTRDLRGMLLYSALLQQGQASRTRVAESTQTATGDRSRVTVGDRLRRIIDRAGLEPDPNRWQPRVGVVAQPQQLPGVQAVVPDDLGP